MRSSSSGHRGAEDDLHAELLEPAREPRRVRVLGVARHDLVADRQDGGEHMTSIREIDVERDASDLVDAGPGDLSDRRDRRRLVVHRLRTVPERSQAATVGRRSSTAGWSAAPTAFSACSSRPPAARDCRVAVREEHRGRGIGTALVRDRSRPTRARSAPEQLIVTSTRTTQASPSPRKRGFTEVRAETEAALDPRRVTERRRPTST